MTDVKQMTDEEKRDSSRKLKPASGSPTSKKKPISPSAAQPSKKLKPISPPAPEPSNKLIPISPSAPQPSKKLKPISPPEPSKKLKPISPPAPEPSNKLIPISPSAPQPSKKLKPISPHVPEPSNKLKSISPSTSEPSNKLRPVTVPPSETSGKLKPINQSPSETSRELKLTTQSPSETSRKLKPKSNSPSETPRELKLLTQSPSETSRKLKPISPSPSDTPKILKPSSSRPDTSKKPNLSSVDSPIKPRSTSPSVDTLFPETPTKSKCCPWCRKEAFFDEELAQIVGERKRRKSADTGRRNLNYTTKRDGCTETGYFTPPKSVGTKTMEGLRKSCKATKNLPNPQEAAEINNSKTSRQAKIKERLLVSEENNVSEINKMLRNRLTGVINLNPDDPNEENEALLSYNTIQRDIQPVILSQLVQGSDTRRISFIADTDRSTRRSSFVLRNIPDTDRQRRRSSIMLRNIDSTIEQTVYNSIYNKMQNKLQDSNDADFINSLPKISNLLKNELESNFSHTQRYIKNLKTLFKNTKFVEQKKKNTKATERWMVILYTTSEEKVNTLTDFNCNLVRLILQHHCVAYEERDIALKKLPFRNQLKKVMGTDDIRVPYVCAKGISVGGVQVIFAMHKMKLVNQIFADFIMPPKLYADWLYGRIKTKSTLNLNVKLSGYPALNQILTTNYEAYLIKADRQKVKIGKVTIKRAREIWSSQSQEPYTEPRLLKFVLLKNTIILAYTILNNVYMEYLPGQPKAELAGRCCRWCR